MSPPCYAESETARSRGGGPRQGHAAAARCCCGLIRTSPPIEPACCGQAARLRAGFVACLCVETRAACRHDWGKGRGALAAVDLRVTAPTGRLRAPAGDSDAVACRSTDAAVCCGDRSGAPALHRAQPS